MPIYDKPVRELMRDMVPALPLGKGQIVTRQEVIDWFGERFPKIKEATVACHLIRLSTNAPSRFHYNAKPVEDDVFFKIDDSRFRLYDAAADPAPLLRAGTGGDIEPVHVDVPPGCEGGSEFAYEHDLRDYLAKNLQLIEPGLRLYTDEDVRGIEFPAGGRYIDILALDASGNYVVIELKVSRGYDRVVGQLLRYVAWIQMHHADPGQSVRGVIISREISEDLRLACHSLPNVSLFEYKLSVSLNRVAIHR